MLQRSWDMKALGIAALMLAWALPAQATACILRPHPHPPEFMIFFAPGSDEITARSKLILDELVSLVRHSPKPFMLLGAETDALEDAAGGDNLRIHEQPVRSYFLAAGFGPDWLFVDASGRRPR